MRYIDSPFKKDKFNVDPDNELCRRCGRCCTVSFSYIPLLPFDFEEGGEEEGLKWLSEKGILMIELANREMGGGYYTPWMSLPNRRCYFLSVDGCMLSPDERPIACTHYGPGLGNGKNDKSGNNCGGRASKWLDDLSMSRYGRKYSEDLVFTSWMSYNNILSSIYESLSEKNKIEVVRLLWDWEDNLIV